jgi:hypothetical protein
MRKSISFKIEGGDPITGVGGQLVLSEDVLMYEAFRELYEADMTANKVIAFQDLKYVKFMGEEEGAFSHLDGHEKNLGITQECYGMPNPRLSKDRLELRNYALSVFKGYEMTEEGQVLEMINSRIHLIRKVLLAQEKKMEDLKTDKDLNDYMNSTQQQTTALLRLTQEKNKIYDAIAKQGGRKEVKNKGGASTSANERGDFNLKAIQQRRAAREAAGQAQTV